MTLKNRYVFFSLIVISFFSFTLCDFTPPLNNEILTAQRYISEQNYQAAVNKYEQILKKHPPKNIQIKINFQLGDLYSIYLSKNEKAAQYYSSILEISDDPLWLIKTQERLGEIYFLYMKDYRKSREIYKTLSEFRPKLSNQDFYQFRYALSSFHLGQKQQAVKVFKEIQKDKRHRYYSRTIYYEGLVHFEQKNWNKAINSWKRYLKTENRRDNIVQAKFLMANAYETIEKLKVAYNIYYSILGEYPNTSVIQNRLKGIYDRRVARKR